MVRVKLRCGGEGRISSFVCEGHAGLVGESGEADLLCAAVSALCGALVIGLQRVVKMPIELREDYGLVGIELLPADADKEREAQVLLLSTAEALRELAEHNVGFLSVEGLPERSGRLQ